MYAADASGNTPPIATIAGSLTGLNDPRGLALDSGGNLYVANYAANSITLYLRGARGNAAPGVTIPGGSTALNYPVGMAF